MKLDMTARIDEAGDVSEWVRENRVKVSEREKAKKEALQKQRMLEEEEEEMVASYSARDLKGLKVMHSGDDFQHGESVVLTLADSNVLEYDEGGMATGINEESDVLENVNLAEAERRLQREKQKKRNLQPVYSGLDDHEFQDSATPGVGPSVLSQYDREKKPMAKMELGDEGRVLLDNRRGAAAALAAIQKIEFLEKIKTEDKKPTASFATFSKPKAGKKKNRNTRRKAEEDEEDSSGEPVNLDDLLGGGETEGVELGARASSGTDHLQSKQTKELNDSSTDLSNIAQEEARRKRNYELAREKAQSLPGALGGTAGATTGAAAGMSTGAASGSHSSGSALGKAPILRVKPKLVSLPVAAMAKKTQEFRSIDFDEEDPDMSAALARARRLALQKKQAEASAKVELEQGAGEMSMAEAKIGAEEDRGAAVVLQRSAGRVARNISATESKAQDKFAYLKYDVGSAGEDPDACLDAEGRRPDGTLVFNNTTEFTTRLQAHMSDRERERAELAFQEKTAARTAPVPASDRKRQREEDFNRLEVEVEDVQADDEDIYGDGAMAESAEEEEEEETGGAGGGRDDQLGFVHEQPLVARGMAATLELLKGSGDLRQKERLAGRAKDSRQVDPSQRERGIKLEYRDDHGNKLTQKEAFRQLSYKFHGYAPGKKKQEKRLKALEAQQASASSREGLGGTMKALTTTQQATGKSFITVQGGANSTGVSAAQLAAVLNKNKIAPSGKSGGKLKGPR